jgi:colanic acid biosynthesis protein WcaH
VENTPLISIDFIIEKDSQYLLGKRINKPAQGYYFTVGGRILKNETINQAVMRISLKEIGLYVTMEQLKFLGIFEHFYHDSFPSDSISTHYIVLAYSLHLDQEIDLPMVEHNEYRYFLKDELISNSHVHPYVKNYFRGEI